MKKITLLLTCFLLLTLNSLFGQSISRHSVYFDVDSYTISQDELNSLKSFISQENTGNYISKIYIKGHTDSDASDSYNQVLSERRVVAVTKQFEGTNLISYIETEALGESNPLNKNLTSEDKKLNRRVEITIEHWVPDIVESNGTIKDLYKMLEQEKQRNCIDPNRDTVLRLEQGTIIYIPAGAFKSDNNECVEIRAKEFYKTSDMIMENLSTTSNGRLLETAGMIYLEAATKERILDLQPGKEVTILMPTDELRDDMQLFYGDRDHDDVMNWLSDNAPALEKINMPPGVGCENYPLDNIADDCVRCKLFFCRFKRVGSRIAGTFSSEKRTSNREFRQCQRRLRKNRRQNVVEAIEQPNLNCQELDSLFEKYGVTSKRELIEKMNEGIMKQYGVKTLEQLADTLRKIKMNEVEQRLSSGYVSQQDLRYYMFNSNRLGWINCDAFGRIEGPKVNMVTNVPFQPQNDCKTIFKDVKGIMPGYGSTGVFSYNDIPKNKNIWHVALKFENEQAYLSLIDDKTKENLMIPVFVPMKVSEIKEQLKVLDK
ncbi:MAG: OmpA family protein [Bacteroidetes bacterium]|nr:MAG: OmpA family protein [Bacteroidota bacterium]